MKSFNVYIMLLLYSVLLLCSCQVLESSTSNEAKLPSTPTPTKLSQAIATPKPTSTARPRPTINPESVLALQIGNDFPIARFYPGYGLTESENNRIGDTFSFDPWEAPCPEFGNDWVGGHIKKLGFKWVRISIDYTELDAAKAAGNFSRSEINLCHDAAVTFLDENDVTIMHTIVYWDEKLHSDRYPNYQNEEEVQQYLDYTRMIVREFKGRIKYYEILNEIALLVKKNFKGYMCHRFRSAKRRTDSEGDTRTTVRTVIGLKIWRRKR